MEEGKAIEKLKKGDVGGLEALSRAYYLLAVRTAYLIMQEKHLAEDVVQNCFIGLLKKIGQFDSSKPFKPWFLRVVINNSISVCRQQKRVQSVDWLEAENLLITGLDGNLEEGIINSEITQIIWQTLSRLSPEQRAAIVMRYFLEMSEVELSIKLKKPKSTVKWILFSARQKLRQLLVPSSNCDSNYDEVHNQENEHE